MKKRFSQIFADEPHEKYAIIKDRKYLQIKLR